MLLFFTLVLILSSLAMIALLYAKHWELTTGHVLFSGVRPKISAYARAALFAVERELPSLFSRVWNASLRWLRTRALGMAARALIAIEHALEQALESLKHGFAPAKGVPASRATGQASMFLREVAEHKRKLTQVTRPRRARQKVILPPQNQPSIEK